MIITNVRPILLQVVYYMPDYPSILNEFTWGFEDRIPELIRTHRFLNHWKANIDAVISEVPISIADDRRRNWRSVDEIIGYN